MADQESSGNVRLAIGIRCKCEGYYGTIKYIGTVPPSEGMSRAYYRLVIIVTIGTWVGVEWDDVERGKHSGWHNGTQYFTCRLVITTCHTTVLLCSHRPNSGSFVRAKKLHLGYTFIEALYQVDTYVCTS